MGIQKGKCKRCGNIFQLFPSTVGRKIFCSKKCQREDGIERRTRTCGNCGKVFLVRATGVYYDDGFCKKECRFKWSEKRIQELHDTGKPLVEITDEGIVCNICSLSMEQAGTHFKRRHGMDTDKQSGHLKRQFLLNIPMGSRLASKRLLEIYKKHGEKHTQNLIKNKPEKVELSEETLELRRNVKKSENQIRTSRKVGLSSTGKDLRLVAAEVAYRKHVKACETRVCPHCSKNFTMLRHQPNKFCSRKCSYDYRVGKPCGPMSKEQKQRLSEIQKARFVHHWIKKDCEWCGKEIECTISKIKKYCSLSCTAKSGRAQVKKRKQKTQINEHLPLE